MAIVFGVNPGGKNSFASAALFWSGRLPASLVALDTSSSVEEAKLHIIGVVGEWGDLAAVAIDAPLTWSGELNGWRASDHALKKRMPSWASSQWHRAPTSLAGSIGVQGPALAWCLASEIKGGALPQHTMVETNPRVCLALVAPALQDSLLAYTAHKTPRTQKREAVERLVTHFVESGVVKLEAPAPQTPEELEALVCAVVALGVAAPDSGLVTHELPGGEIRPLGARPIVLLEALP